VTAPTTLTITDVCPSIPLLIYRAQTDNQTVPMHNHQASRPSLHKWHQANLHKWHHSILQLPTKRNRGASTDEDHHSSSLHLQQPSICSLQPWSWRGWRCRRCGRCGRCCTYYHQSWCSFKQPYSIPRRCER
jgi:hypothetical protein